ncbi:MAG: pyridoxine kinase [Ponticaulis sp.]|nr:pyridoxine kinase [Ponticaulis sp.]|tara:strand:- start:2019 stop:2885 length:867 start_codon:yes stop_codon:yes gene_type:complete
MKRVLVISSFVAGSNVGGNVALKILPQLGCEANLLPTVLFGRHPGWGLPGGGAVPDEYFAGITSALVANEIPQKSSAIVTGYFASAKQVKQTAELIDRHMSSDQPLIVDAVMGDFGKGLYVKEEVAEAIVSLLIPRARLVKCNAWEFWEIERRLGNRSSMPECPQNLTVLSDHLKMLPTRRGRWLVTSVQDGPLTGLFGFHESDNAYSGIERRQVDHLPNGLGDAITALVALASHSPQTTISDYIGQAMRYLSALIDVQITDRASELNLLGFQLHDQNGDIPDIRKVW